MASETELHQLIASIVGVDASEITNEATLEEIGWDSLSVLEFIARLDSNFGVRTSTDSLSRASSVGELLAAVEKQ